MTRIGSTRPCRQQHSPTPRTGHDHVTGFLRAGILETELVEQTHAARPDQISAGLVAADACFVHQPNSGPGTGKHERGNASGRASPDDDDVVTCFRQ